jgi:hypothetical protein
MAANRLAILTLALLAGCGGDRAASMAADSLSRDLQRVPVDSSAMLSDQAAATPVTPPAPVAAKPKAKPRPAPKPAPKPAPAPAPLSLAAGSVLATSADREITSRTDKPGATVTGTVASDVTDASGRVVIPAGSKVTMTITEIHESENKGDKTGKLTLTPTSVQIGGESHAIDGSAVALERTLRDRKTNGGDVAKVGAGTAIGAVAGRVIGGNTKGAIIGGIIGGAVGTQRAIETQDRDVVVPANSRVEVTLGGTFTR